MTIATHATTAPLGDQAVLVRLGTVIEAEVADSVARLAQVLEARDIAGVTEIVCSYASLALYLEDPSSQDAVMHEVRAVLEEHPSAPGENAGTPRPPREHVIRVRYNGVDIAESADLLALSVRELIQRHCARPYRAYAVGFVPGFAYLGVLDEKLRLPRRARPRERVPAGSVAIAGAQTAVYPFATPGGWRLIGTTDAMLFDPDRDEAALIAVGDTVRFEDVDG